MTDGGAELVLSIVKWVMLPFILLVFIVSCVGSVFERALFFWMEEPVYFWNELRVDLWDLLGNYKDIDAR